MFDGVCCSAPRSTASVIYMYLTSFTVCVHFVLFQDSLPLLDRYLGKYNFSVNISPNSKRVPTFSKDLNTFFVQCQNSFAVEFSVRCDGLVPNLHVRAMVCYSDPTYLAEHGPILPCSCNAHTSTRSECVKYVFRIVCT